MKAYFFIALFLLTSNLTILAQVGVQSGVGLSYTGYNYFLEATYQWKAHELSLGPKLLLSDTAVPTEGPWGIRWSYRYTVLEKNRLSGFAQLNYQLTWLEVYNPNNLPNNDHNRIHEVHFIYGFHFKIGQQWRITQSLGVGGYMERLVDLIGEKISRNNGFSAWVGLGVERRF